ncbi:hypothetical protein A3709_10950 [Halioglobus sp. HI00S01]|uniref:glycosyltransferase family 4 protein n=1 Tax=Halioglobus sp. HI00S01 TaxID=1822214 RepID=UPI0007C21079|nr:glycosyltransferase family 4 protein [Halioglobus sp. HI00S01]KZX51328.1 hypothetical protein A3709_10950 [Halioglobus sp. HI00S01]
MKVLFISRAYPPVIGGIEKQNYELAAALGQKADVELIVNTRGKAWLPIFLPWSLILGLFKAPRADVVLLGDAVLAPVGALLRLLTRRPVACVVHGLDITWDNAIYQSVWVKGLLSQMNRLLAVGNETIRQAVSRGLAEERCRFIPNGVATPATASEVDSSATYIEGGDDTFHLLTLGRLIKRKGVAWFASEVMPKLPENTHYWVAGDGPCRVQLEQLVSERDLQDRVHVLGRVSELQKQALLSQVSLFVQPNIAVEGDMEGFGLVVLEAAAAGLPVVASRLEGLQDAISEGKNGVLVESGNVDAYVATIEALAADPAHATHLGEQGRDYTLTHCLWDQVADLYLRELGEISAR